MAHHVEIVFSRDDIVYEADAIAHGRESESDASLRRALSGWLPLALTALLFLATRCWFLAAFEPALADITHYRESARHGVDCGQTPYRDFLMEYPPVAYWLMTVPRLIDRQTYPGEQATPEAIKACCSHYERWYRVEMLLADVVCFGLLFAIGRRQLPRAAWLLPAAYCVATIAQPHLIYDRLDLGLLMLVLLAVECWSRSQRSARPNLWACGAYLFLGLGISFKLVPVVMVPFFVLADFLSLGLGRRLVERVVVLSIAAVGPFLYYLCTAGSSVWSMFRYHAERGIHLESVWGSVLLASARFGMPCGIKRQFGGHDVLCDWTPLMKLGSQLALPAVVGLLMLWAVLNRRRFSRRMACDAALVAVIASAAASHVFSPQYLNWIVPTALVVGLSVLPRRVLPWCIVGGLSLFAIGVSAWLWPHHYDGFIRGTDVASAWLSIGRSACLVTLAGMLSGFLLVRMRTARLIESPRPAEPVRVDSAPERTAKKRGSRSRSTLRAGSV